MHLLIEALSARLGGGVTRLLGIADALLRVAPQHQYSIVLAPSYQQSIIEALPREMQVIPIDAEPANLVSRAWFQSVRLPRIADEHRADAIFAAGEGAYLRTVKPLVMMSGNLLLFGSGNTGRLRRALRRPFLLGSLRTASKIAFVSGTMRDLVCQRFDLGPAKTFVMYHGVAERFAPAPDARDGSYYLAVSSIDAHKGYETLIAAYARLPAYVPALRIAGAISDRKLHRRLVDAIDSHGLGERVEFLGPVAFDRLPALYAGARALLFPSEVESFGLPMIEAMASGTPVIASDLPVSREICGDAALYFPPRDADRLAARVVEIDGDVERRLSMRAAGVARAAHFTWEDAARRLVAEVERLVEPRRSEGIRS